MKYTIKDLQAQWLSKTLIYEVLKTVPTISKEFIKNKRIFNDNDLKIFKYYKEFWKEATIFFVNQSQNQLNSNTVLNSSQTVKTEQKNTLEDKEEYIKKLLQEELKKVSQQFLEKEKELKTLIEQKESIIKVKDEQAQKYALLKQEEKKEKEEWIKKYESINKEKSKWVEKYYNIKMYMVLFAVLFVLSSIIGFIIYFK